MITTLYLIFVTVWHLYFNGFLVNSIPIAHKNTTISQIYESNHLYNRKYAIVIDAGSSGSRIIGFEYKFQNVEPNALPSIDNLDVDLAQDPTNPNATLIHKISPGLSSFANNATVSAEYLFELIDSIVEKIPPDSLPGTPLYILATAGMRLIKSDQQEAILEDCRRDIAKRYPQLKFPPSHVQIISGKMEGVYAWIAINYILGKFKQTPTQPDLNISILNNASIANDGKNEDINTVGILDMGGASLQIAFQVPSNYALPTPQELRGISSIDMAYTMLRDSFFDIDLSGRQNKMSIPDNEKKAINNQRYRLYVKTFLGFGANEIIENYHKQLITNYSHVDKPFALVEDPCFPTGYNFSLKHPNSPATELKFVGIGDFETCANHHLTPMLKLNTHQCILDPCSIDGAHLPALNFDGKTRDSNKTMKFYGFSEFWYTAHDILSLGGTYNASQFKQAAAAYCNKPYEESRKEMDNYPNADEHRLINQCVKSAWLYSVLHNGFKFSTNPANPQLESVQLVEGKEVHWGLGALIYALLNHDNVDERPHEIFGAANNNNNSDENNLMIKPFLPNKSIPDNNINNNVIESNIKPAITLQPVPVNNLQNLMENRKNKSVKDTIVALTDRNTKIAVSALHPVYPVKHIVLNKGTKENNEMIPSFDVSTTPSIIFNKGTEKSLLEVESQKNNQHVNAIFPVTPDETNAIQSDLTIKTTKVPLTNLNPLYIQDGGSFSPENLYWSRLSASLPLTVRPNTALFWLTCATLILLFALMYYIVLPLYCPRLFFWRKNYGTKTKKYFTLIDDDTDINGNNKHFTSLKTDTKNNLSRVDSFVEQYVKPFALDIKHNIEHIFVDNRTVFDSNGSNNHNINNGHSHSNVKYNKLLPAYDDADIFRQVETIDHYSQSNINLSGNNKPKIQLKKAKNFTARSHQDTFEWH